jgi:hypothetical protein
LVKGFRLPSEDRFKTQPLPASKSTNQPRCIPEPVE